MPEKVWVEAIPIEGSSQYRPKLMFSEKVFIPHVNANPCAEYIRADIVSEVLRSWPEG